MVKREIPPIENLVRAMLALRHKTGRELAIVGASWLDLILEQNLRSSMEQDLSEAERRKLFDHVGPLSTISAKIDVARAFDLISAEARAQSHLVNGVRNAFAHTIEDLDSDSPSVAKYIDQMTLTLDQVMGWLTVDPSRPDPTPPTAFVFDGERFEYSAVSGILDADAETVLFFMPSIDVQNRDDRLRQQIFACTVGAAGRGLKPWIQDSAPAGGLARAIGNRVQALNLTP
jgi:hypothetical protein